MKKRITVFVLVAAMLMTMSLGSAMATETEEPRPGAGAQYRNDEDIEGNGHGGALGENHNRGEDSNENGHGGALGENHNRGDAIARRAAIAELSAEKRALQIQIRAMRQELEEAEEGTDTSELEEDIAELGEQIRNLVRERRNFILGEYTEEELDEFKQAGENIRNRRKHAHVLGMDSVMIGKKILKFDSAPFIENGRTLIPVRAVTEGMGAVVEWDPGDGENPATVTITKDETVIVLTIGSTTAMVNDEEVEIDVFPNIENSRTYVPLRFIAEQLGLKVEWDGENELIEIEDPDEDEDEADEDEDDDDEEDGTEE